MPDTGPARALQVAGRAAPVRFLAVGALNTAASYVVFCAVVWRLGPARAGFSQAVAYGAGSALSYVLNRRWTFASPAAHRYLAHRFVAANATTLVVSVCLVQLGVGPLGLAPPAAWLASVGVTTLVNYRLQKRWVFARP
jgi:putative flippase GtrA